MRVFGMLTGVTIRVTAKDRAKLEAILANRNSPQKHVWRARIILLTADGLGTNAVMRGTGRSKSVVCPEFVPKLRDIVGLGASPRAGHGPDPWVNPPAHAIVLSVDEKSQIQALDRTQPGLPI